MAASAPRRASMATVTAFAAAAMPMACAGAATPTDIAAVIAAGDRQYGFIAKRGLRPSFFVLRAAVVQCDHVHSCFDKLACPSAEAEAILIDYTVHKVTKAQVGGVTEPGRYLF